METQKCAECHSVLPVDEMIRYGTIFVCGNCKPRFLQKLAEGVALPGSVRYAGFWRRFLAQMIDGIILMIVFIPLQFLILSRASNGLNTAGDISLVLLLYALQIVTAFSYETVLIWKHGATVGKMACQIQVITADGKDISYVLSLGRYFAKLLSQFTLFIGYIMAAFDHEKRALHDRICNTRVVMK